MHDIRNANTVLTVIAQMSCVAPQQQIYESEAFVVLREVEDEVFRRVDVVDAFFRAVVDFLGAEAAEVDFWGAEAAEVVFSSNSLCNSCEYTARAV